VLVSSWDNAVYSYSVSHACALGKKVVHEDGVSTLSMDTTDRLIVTGSWDTAVKVFEVKADKGTLGNSVVAEFYDLESSVQAVDVNGSGAFIAAGAEDGTLIIWNAHTQHIQVSTQIGNSSSPISSLCWMPMPFLLAVDPQKPHRNEKLVCVSMDGTMVIMDYSGRLCGAVKVDVPIRSVVAGVAVASPQPLGMHQNPAGSKHVIFGGCEDGSLRVWACDDAGTGLSGAFTGPTSIYEVFRFPDAHMGAVTSLALRNQLLVSGGEDGTLRLWRLAVQT
jgi:WD40 repeat protein